MTSFLPPLTLIRLLMCANIFLSKHSTAANETRHTTFPSWLCVFSQPLHGKNSKHTKWFIKIMKSQITSTARREKSKTEHEKEFSGLLIVQILWAELCMHGGSGNVWLSPWLLTMKHFNVSFDASCSQFFIAFRNCSRDSLKSEMCFCGFSGFSSPNFSFFPSASIQTHKSKTVRL